MSYLGLPDNHRTTRRLSVAPRDHSDHAPSPVTRKIDELCRKVDYEWPELGRDNANILEVSLSLMDTSSIGKARFSKDYEKLTSDISNVLKDVVNDNYQGFNSSVGSYRSIAQSIAESHDNVRQLKQQLVESKSALSRNKPILKELGATSQRYKQMIQILEKIKDLKAVPDKLDTEISKKQFLSAQETLHSALRFLDDDGLASISSLEGLKTYLLAQESTIFAHLVEELHSHLYLKSPYCDRRWVGNISNLSSQSLTGARSVGDIEQVIMDKLDHEISKGGKATMTFSGSEELRDFLSDLAEHKDQPFEESTTSQMANPEQNSFIYIQLILETVNNLNRLPSLFEIVDQRLPIEIHKLVDKTVQEVAARFPKSLRDLQEYGGDNTEERGNSNNPSATGYLSDFFGPINGDIGLNVLKDLVWTLYSKLSACLEGHRAFYEVSKAITNRHDGHKKTLEYNFLGVWQTMESEVKMLLRSYITDASNISAPNRLDFDIPAPFRPMTKRSSSTRKPLFKLDNPGGIPDEFNQENDILRGVLEHSVPGLASASGNALHSTSRNAGSPFVTVDTALSHEMLTPPNVFNVRAFLDPTLLFMQKVQNIFPDPKVTGISHPRQFLDEFLSSVFLPQLEDSLENAFSATVESNEAFQITDGLSSKLAAPIFKSAEAFSTLVFQLCRLLNTSSLYREKYTSLILSLISKFVARYKIYFQTLISWADSDKDQSKIRLCARWAEEPKLRTISTEIVRNSLDTNQLIDEETTILLKLQGGLRKIQIPITKQDTLDPKSFRAMCTLVSSLEWSLEQLESLRNVVTETPPTSASGDSMAASGELRKRWTLTDASKLVSSSSESVSGLVKLTLAGQAVDEFDRTMKEYKSLSSQCLVTLRCDIRVRVMHYIEQAMINGDYYLDHPLDERDTFVSQLDADILQCDECMSGLLNPNFRHAVLKGVSKYIDNVFVASTQSLHALNANGVAKLLYNIHIIQQMLKSIMESPQQITFSSSLKYYELFDLDADTILAEVKEGKLKQFSTEDLRTLIKLKFNDVIHQHERLDRHEAVSSARTQLQSALTKLNETKFNDAKKQAVPSLPPRQEPSA
ncbi:Sec8 exocyst complex component-specific domain-domain-containing protein [Yarrowia lipolytica]|jgi:exocyst complex component 4|uniref:Exocyst complex component Sec8 n=2 Tax=Yarrowia lipolytica TaxID=4952 RepID=Q6C3L8_YARLI|nr:YALI0E33759p [Yarrowia lipolytica CLIB122]AOW06354.1 hypothetical protein YALI1_E40032g [Yarrowia lipolytica]KAB8282660.1 Sec8 exocyst complex component-specific domain-containing protein [Yarrowia lipolytica]KAE8171194.1 Sec8 exocyst complex component-specific domain-containing protein [Yarrowia lipolytica]KAJ8057725.1 Sec8 exocyst complex component-specific domain-containing protein [Yarrowia lipolytica]QNQ00971.1 Putative exocyst complex component sec8 [Yarrowia lipolytica]|eukprot:XP_504744.1 YALI0E33759p [Yarrowia lipolytica CLIB122]